MHDQADDVRHSSASRAAPPSAGGRGQRLAAVGGIVGALLASSCCVLPLGLAVLGVGGAWMSGLRALAPYQPFFVAVAVAAIAFGFFQSYRKPRESRSAGEVCSVTLSNRLSRFGLWLAAAIVAMVISFPYWFSIAEPYLP